MSSSEWGQHQQSSRLFGLSTAASSAGGAGVVWGTNVNKGSHQGNHGQSAKVEIPQLNAIIAAVTGGGGGSSMVSDTAGAMNDGDDVMMMDGDNDDDGGQMWVSGDPDPHSHSLEGPAPAMTEAEGEGDVPAAIILNTDSCSTVPDVVDASKLVNGDANDCFSFGYIPVC